MLSEISSTTFRLEWADTYEAGLRGIRRAEHDVYLLDYLQGARNGLDLLREAVAGGCETPIILLTGHGGYDVDVKAMEAGAADYLVKGQITADLLERSIRYSIVQKHADAELRSTETIWKTLLWNTPGNSRKPTSSLRSKSMCAAKPKRPARSGGHCGRLHGFLPKGYSHLNKSFPGLGDQASCKQAS